MAFTLGNKCTKNCCKRTVLVQLIVEDIVKWFFLEHSVDAPKSLSFAKMAFSSINQLELVGDVAVPVSARQAVLFWALRSPDAGLCIV